MAKGKKTGGRTKGTPNTATREVAETCRALVEDKAYRANLALRLVEGKLHASVEALLWHYAYGKPKETVEHQGLTVPAAVTFVITRQDGAECRP